MTVNHDVVGSSPTAGVTRGDHSIISLFLHLIHEEIVKKRVRYEGKIEESMTFFLNLGNPFEV